MRKTIVIIGIMMAFILGSLVSAPSVYAPAGGAALLAEQVAEIEDIIRRMQDQLDNIRVTWDRVDAKPSGFADNIDNDLLSEISASCTMNQIVKWVGNQWVCADEITGPSGSTEFVITITGPNNVIEIFPDINVIKNFKITGLPSSTNQYKIPINLIQLGANMGAVSGSFEILLEESSDGVTFSQFFFIGVADSAPIFKSIDHIQANTEHIQIEAEDTEKFFRLIGRTFGASPTGSFDNLKFVMSLPLPEGATIEFIPPI